MRAIVPPLEGGEMLLRAFSAAQQASSLAYSPCPFDA